MIFAASRRRFAVALATLCGLWAATPADAQLVDCNRISLQLSSLARNSGSARMSAAAQKQAAEIARMSAYARSIGCDRPQFLFFGDRPPQCAGINAQIQRMQANYGQLQRSASGDSGLRRELQNQYEVYCRGRQPNFLERMLGQDRDYPAPDEEPETRAEPVEDPTPRGGAMAVCVRTCDGGFFPLSYSARRSSLSNLQELCTALCPNTEAKLYTRPMKGDMKGAVSIDGEAYTDLPAAFKYEKAFDSSCTCKPANKSWVEALAEAERLIGEGRKGDILVTPEKAEELSRPKQAGQPAAPAGKPKKFDPKAAQMLLEQRKSFDAQAEAERAAAARVAPPGADSSGIDVGPDTTATIVGPQDGQVREERGPDGARRRLRVIGE